MAKYTTELNNAIRLYGYDNVLSWFTDYNLLDYLTKEEAEKIANKNLWTKEKLAKKILTHYMFFEIGFETIALFREYAKARMNEIMAYYLPLIYSTTIDYDILDTEDYVETFVRNSSDETTGSSSGSGLTINSDTPQGEISKSKILEGKYASSTSAGESTTSSSGSGNSREDYTRKIKGKRNTKTYSSMILEYRKSIINIDEMIIKDLKDLFMGIY